MFNRLREKRQYKNVVDMEGRPVNRSYPVDDALRCVGRLVHKAVRRVIVKAYMWNKVADCR